MGKIRKTITEKLRNADFVIVSAAAVISAALNFCFTVLARRYVPPLEYGIYSTCLLLQTYLSYAQLGVLNAYNRDYPQLAGAGQEEKLGDLKNTAFTFFMGIYVLLTIIIGVVLEAAYLSGSFKKEYYIGYMLSMLLLIVNTLSDFGMNTMRMEGGYHYTALVTVIRTMLGAAVGLIAVRVSGYYGLYVMPAISGLAAVLLYYGKTLKGIRLQINKSILAECLRTGFPLMVNSFVWTAVASIDKFVILGFMDTKALGIYSVAQLGFTAMVLIPQSVSQVFYIKISRDYGRTGDEGLLVRACSRYTCINSICTSIICVAGYYVLPVFVKIVMPGYMSGIEAAQIMLIGIAIYGSTMLYGNIFSILKRNKDLLWTSIALCLFNIIFSVGLVSIFGRNIENVAIGTATSYAAFSLLLVNKISNGFEERKIVLLKSSWMPVFVSVFPTIVLYYLIPNIYVGIILSVIYLSGISLLMIKVCKIEK